MEDVPEEVVDAAPFGYDVLVTFDRERWFAVWGAEDASIDLIAFIAATVSSGDVWGEPNWG